MVVCYPCPIRTSNKAHPIVPNTPITIAVILSLFDMFMVLVMLNN